LLPAVYLPYYILFPVFFERSYRTVKCVSPLTIISLFCSLTNPYPPSSREIVPNPLAPPSMQNDQTDQLILMAHSPFPLVFQRTFSSPSPGKEHPPAYRAGPGTFPPPLPFLLIPPLSDVARRRVFFPTFQTSTNAPTTARKYLKASSPPSQVFLFMAPNLPLFRRLLENSIGPFLFLFCPPNLVDYLSPFLPHSPFFPPPWFFFFFSPLFYFLLFFSRLGHPLPELFLEPVPLRSSPPRVD